MLDLSLLIVPMLLMMRSLIYDIAMGHHDFFQRSGVMMVLALGYSAYRS